jgi:hypothetical protein
MSNENMELIRSAYEAYSRGDVAMVTSSHRSWRAGFRDAVGGQSPASIRWGIPPSYSADHPLGVPASAA